MCDVRSPASHFRHCPRTTLCKTATRALGGAGYAPRSSTPSPTPASSPCMSGSCPTDVASGITCQQGVQLFNVPAAQIGVGTCMCNWQGSMWVPTPLYAVNTSAACTQSACTASSSFAGDGTPSFVDSTALAAWIISESQSIYSATTATGSVCGSMAIACNSNAVSQRTCPPALLGSTLTVQFPFTVGTCEKRTNKLLSHGSVGSSDGFFAFVVPYSSISYALLGESFGGSIYGLYVCNTNNCNTPMTAAAAPTLFCGVSDGEAPSPVSAAGSAASPSAVFLVSVIALLMAAT